MYARAFLCMCVSFALSAPADACLNPVRMKRDKAVKLVADAEKALGEGKHAEVKKLLDGKNYYVGMGMMSWETDDENLAYRAKVLIVTAHVRGGTKHGDDVLVRFGELAAEVSRGDTLTVARHAEAQVVLGDEQDRAAGAQSLLEMADRDLLAEPEPWALVSKLRADKGDAAGAKAAAETCRKMTRRKGVCPAAQS